MRYQEQLEKPEWREKSSHTLRRDNWTCLGCGASGVTLNAHHKRYNRNGFIWQVPDEWLETLCEDCHKHRHEIENAIRMLPVDQFFQRFGDIETEPEPVEPEIVFVDREIHVEVKKSSAEARELIDYIYSLVDSHADSHREEMFGALAALEKEVA